MDTSWFDEAVRKIWEEPYIVNDANYCDRLHHPTHGLGYRRLRRTSKNRCSVCGARIGEVKLRVTTNYSEIVDTLYSKSPLVKLIDRT